MDTLKTGFIVVLLLAVLYGVYVVLNKDQAPPNAEIAWHQQEAEKDLQIEVGAPSTFDPPSSAGPGIDAKSAHVDPLNKSADLGIPSVLKAELSSNDEVYSTSATEKPVAVQAQGIDEATTSASNVDPPVATPPTPFPATTPTSVSPPSLLASPPKPESAPPTTPGVEETNPKSSDLTALPRLRETPATSSAALPTTLPTTESKESTGQLPKPDSTPPSANGDLSTPLPTTSPQVPGVSDTLTPAGATNDSPGIAISTTGAFTAAMREAHTNISEENWYQALFLLSQFYNSPDLSSQQRQELVDLLDPLAAKVVYSAEHLVTIAHEVKRGETLDQIAQQNQVPADLLANINGVEKTGLLIPGIKLKVVRGPFRADVDLQRQELTLFAGQLYAGRFPITVGKEPAPQPGEYRVTERLPGKDFYGNDGQTISADDPRNPYGRVWLGLGKEMAIHSSPERGDNSTAGCISLSPLDAHDVFSILSEGSSVVVR